MRHILPEVDAGPGNASAHVRDVLVLCYHALSPDWPAALSTTPERLEQQVSSLLTRGYRPATFAQAVADPPAPRTVAVTFDDAFTSVLDHARPILDRLGAPATLFVATDYPERTTPMVWTGTDQWLGGRWHDQLKCATWDDLRGLADAGWEIGSHTRSHPRLTQLDDTALADELEGSRAVCEEALGRPCESIAYPYGDFDGRVVEAAGRAGYRYGATLTERIRRPEPLYWPRTGIYHVDAAWRARLKFSPLVRRVRALTGGSGPRLSTGERTAIKGEGSKSSSRDG
jgi:peptidoglycan/xylan/chitin deacetylase (PgdA/CDA1 family)